MRSVGNCGDGFAREVHEARSTISRWRIGPNEHPLNSLGESAAPGRAGDSPMVTAVAELPPLPDGAPPSLTGPDSQGSSTTVTSTPVPFVDAAPLGDADRPHERDGTPNPSTDK